MTNYVKLATNKFKSTPSWHQISFHHHHDIKSPLANEITCIDFRLFQYFITSICHVPNTPTYAYVYHFFVLKTQRENYRGGGEDLKAQNATVSTRSCVCSIFVHGDWWIRGFKSTSIDDFQKPRRCNLAEIFRVFPKQFAKTVRFCEALSWFF